MRGCAATLAIGAALGVTSTWHAWRGGWWPLVALVVACAVVGVVTAISRRGEKQ